MRKTKLYDVAGFAAKPTKAHRLAIWPGILGTVYAMDADGEISFCGHNYAYAASHAGIDASLDTRVAPMPKNYGLIPNLGPEYQPKVGARCIWVKDEQIIDALPASIQGKAGIFLAEAISEVYELGLIDNTGPEAEVVRGSIEGIITNLYGNMIDLMIEMQGGE